MPIVMKRKNGDVAIIHEDTIEFRYEWANKPSKTERIRRTLRKHEDCVAGHINCLKLEGYEVVTDETN